MSSEDEDTIEIEVADGQVGPIIAESFDEAELDIAALTHQGKVRTRNEDQYAIVRRTRRSEVLASSLPKANLHTGCQSAWLLAIADGLGGHVSGDIASATAITTILNFANNLSSWVMRPTDGLREDFQERVELYAQAIQQELQDQAAKNPRLSGMGTTVTAAYVYGRNALIVNLGDSRSYFVRDGEMHQITRDHTLGSDLQLTGVSAKAVHPYRNILTRCFNTGGDMVEMDLFHLNLEAGDRILLCTDGLTNMVHDDVILDQITGAASTKLAVEHLTQTALDNGGRDNVTIVMANVN